MEFRILGPLQVLRDGEAVEPGSPKQRALLVNLVVQHGRAVSRDRLIDDLWSGSPPATGLGVLQNYVSQLRRALGPDVVVTQGPGYLLDVEPEAVDSARFEALVDEGRAALEAGRPTDGAGLLRRAMALWRGPALADVAGEPFARVEISRLEELRDVALELLLESEIAAGRHREAVAGLEAAVADHPFRERLWWLLMLALARSGRQADALRAYQRARAALAEELGLEPGSELRRLEAAIIEQREDLDDLLAPAFTRQSRPQPSSGAGSPPAGPDERFAAAPVPAPASPRRPPERRARPATALLGRAPEWSAIEAFLERGDGAGGGLLLLVGEPGIGKTRLLEEVALQVESRRGAVIAGRAFEAERGRPYGAWVDALRGAPWPELEEPLRAALAPLLPELAGQPVELDDPSRLYQAVVGLLGLLAERSPVAVLVDDAHWLDESSFSLLHFAIRHLAGAGVAFLVAARPAELDANRASAAVMQALRRDGALTEVLVGPLAPDAIAELTGPIAPAADPTRIARATHGNPLFAIEMARALAQGGEPLSPRIDGLITDRLARLDERASSLLPWMAAFGRGLTPAVLGQLLEREPFELFEPLGDLERHGVLRAGDDGTIDFVHDLVRSSAYQQLSPARRAVLHARIGVVQASFADPDDSLAADAARHADLGGDSGTCARSCARAARRCLRLVAYEDAAALVSVGRTHARNLPPAERVAVELDLIRVLLHPGVRLRDPDLTRDLTGLCAEAQRLGLRSELWAGLNLLARAYHWGWGDIPKARALMQRAAQGIGNAGEPDLEPLLESARCLAYLEADMERTARLFDELGALHALADHSFQYQWGLGLVRAWRGDVAGARASLGLALERAEAGGEHWVAFECTARLALLHLEAGDLPAAESWCAQLPSLAAKLGEGSERPYGAAIVALGRVARQEAGAVDDLDAAIGELQRIDARFLVPDLHGIAAEAHLRAGELDRAHERAMRAARLAGDVARPFETARAHAVLACVAARRGDGPGARSLLEADGDAEAALPGHVRGLRREAERLLAARPEDQGVDSWP